MTGSFYYGRWHKFTDAVLTAMKEGREFVQDDFQKEIIDWEYEWTLQHEDFPLNSGEDPVAVAKELRDKYAKEFK